MIFGDELIITREGIHVSSKSLETIGIFPDTEVYILPFRTFEFRETEPGYHFSYDFLITPIPPPVWPFVVRFVIRLKNRPGMVEKVLNFLQERKINILFAEGTRSGHHHLTLNVLGELKLIEVMHFNKVIEKIFKWKIEINDLKQKIDETFENKTSEEYENKVWWWKAVKFYSLTRIILILYKQKIKNKKIIKNFFEDSLNEFKKISQKNKNDLGKKLEKFKKKLKGKKIFIKIKDENLVNEILKLLFCLLRENLNNISTPIIEEIIKIINNYSSSENWYFFLQKVLNKTKTNSIDSSNKKQHSLANQENNDSFNETEEIIHYAGIFLALKYSDQNKTLYEIMEEEIKNERDQVEITSNHLYDINNAATSKDIYKCMENLTIPLRIILGTLLNFKNVYCDILKVSLIENALSLCIQKNDKRKISLSKKCKTPTKFDDSCKEDLKNSIYIYNIKYYLMVLQFPYFNDFHLFSFYFLNIPEIKHKLDDIISILKELDDDRGRPMEMGNRIDLDPIQITPLEFLSHAYYHRIYSSFYPTTTKKSFIPFPSDYNFFENILNKYLPFDNSASLAIASRNTDDYTLRICPLPIRSLKRFRQINIEKYSRECINLCIYKGKQFHSKIVNQNCFNFDNIDKKLLNDNRDLKGCTGTSAGLLWHLTSSLKNVNNSAVKENLYRLNIWRLYNKNFKFSKYTEKGSIYFLVQASGASFPGFSETWGNDLSGRFENVVSGNYKSGHVNITSPKIQPISGGRIFVSLSFNHPMRETWLRIIKDIGKSYGFKEIDTVESYLIPVTLAVAEALGQSHGFLQVLAAAPETIENYHFSDYEAEFTWLNSEYLAARSKGLQVVRLVDTLTIDPSQNRLGKDHATINFNVLEPIEKFEEVVKKAFKQLRDGLADTLGLS